VSETSWESLRELFLVKYESFRARLRRRLGSDDLAQESLHETWLQLARPATAKSVIRPDSYLFGMALNVAAGLRRVEARNASRRELDAAIDLADEAAGPYEAVESRFDLEELERAIRELTPRRRAILLAARIQGLPTQTIADKLRLSRRTVEIELKRAVEFCAARLGRSKKDSLLISQNPLKDRTIDIDARPAAPVNRRKPQQ
jgi:RNA polymerase sigma-70 factor (ECF subfamily)